MRDEEGSRGWGSTIFASAAFGSQSSPADENHSGSQFVFKNICPIVEINMLNLNLF